MKKAILSNLVANVASQALVFLVMAYAASIFPSADFARFGVIMGVVSIISPILTFQLERLYVSMPLRKVHAIYRMHLGLVTYAHFILLPVIFLVDGAVFYALSFGLCLNQIQNYYLARCGDFKKIWISKVLQGVITSASILLILHFKMYDCLAIAYSGGWLVPTALLFKKKDFISLLHFNLSGWIGLVRKNYAMIKSCSASIFLVNAIREFPVFFISIHYGAGQSGSVVLINRLLSQPMGLIGKSISPILTRLLGENEFSKRDIASLKVMFLGSAAIPAAFFCFVSFTDYYVHYPSVVYVSGCLAFTVFIQFCIGSLGPVFIKLQCHQIQLKNYSFQMCAILLASVISWFFPVAFEWYLGAVTLVCLVIAVWALFFIYKKLVQLPSMK